MDWLIDGTLSDWPASLWIIRERKGVSMTCAPYTNEKDESAPQSIRTACMDLEGDFESKPAAIAFAESKGFKPQ